MNPIVKLEIESCAKGLSQSIQALQEAAWTAGHTKGAGDLHEGIERTARDMDTEFKNAKTNLQVFVDFVAAIVDTNDSKWTKIVENADVAEIVGETRPVLVLIENATTRTRYIVTGIYSAEMNSIMLLHVDAEATKLIAVADMPTQEYLQSI